MDLILIAENLERIGDHVTHIAEDVTLDIEARNLKHAGKLAGGLPPRPLGGWGREGLALSASPVSLRAPPEPFGRIRQPMRPDPQAFARLMFPALQRAAAIARALEGRVQNRPKQGESSAAKAALTVADSDAQEALLTPLLEHFPEVSLAAEEDTPTAARFPRGRDALVVVDPIDGTLRSYLHGEGPYAVLLGLALDGRYEVALVALPREGLLFESVRGKGARFAAQDGPLRPARLDPTARGVMVSYGAPEAVRARLRERGFEVVQGCGGAIAVAPLLPGLCGGLRIANQPEGISIRGRIGVLAAEEAGAFSASEAEAPFPGSLDDPARALLVACNAEVLEALRDALAAAND